MTRFLSQAEVLELHSHLITEFGGSEGVRDLGLLEAALAQPGLEIFGAPVHPTIGKQAAAYLFHLARNHPFVDGNKRTAYATTAVFLRLNGYRLGLSADERFELVLQVARGEMSKEALAQNLAENLIRLEAR